MSSLPSDRPTIAVVIPALNEASSIGRVIADLPAESLREIVVVDNGSTDRTADVARAAGATVLLENRGGYGWACSKGIEYLASNPPDIVVFLDGDYSDHPDELPAVVQPILDDLADFVIGSRMIGTRDRGALLPQAIVGNTLACGVIRWMSGVRFTDLGPFRAIRYDSLLALDLQEMRFGWTVEMQIKAVKAGLRCAEVPVSYRKRVGVSKVTGTLAGTVKASGRILWLLGRYMVGR